jgi:hypothetical protein
MDACMKDRIMKKKQQLSSIINLKSTRRNTFRVALRYRSSICKKETVKIKELSGNAGIDFKSNRRTARGHSVTSQYFFFHWLYGPLLPWSLLSVS